MGGKSYKTSIDCLEGWYLKRRGVGKERALMSGVEFQVGVEKQRKERISWGDETLITRGRDSA